MCGTNIQTTNRPGQKKQKLKQQHVSFSMVVVVVEMEVVLVVMGEVGLVVVVVLVAVMLAMVVALVVVLVVPVGFVFEMRCFLCVLFLTVGCVTGVWGCFLFGIVSCSKGCLFLWCWYCVSGGGDGGGGGGGGVGAGGTGTDIGTEILRGFVRELCCFLCLFCLAVKCVNGV
jgi:uncharacterized membrane protein YgcG